MARLFSGIAALGLFFGAYQVMGTVADDYIFVTEQERPPVKDAIPRTILAFALSCGCFAAADKAVNG